LSYAAFWASARRIELASIVVCAVITSFLWARELPTEILRPDLAPEQLVQLLSALQASSVVLAVRRDAWHVDQLASVRMVSRRLVWLIVVLLLTGVSTLTAALAMDGTVASEYTRNVAAYVGAGIALGTLSTTLGLAVSWIWFALSVTVGQASDQGVATAEWWAYPLQDAQWHPEIAVAMVCVGVVAWSARR